MHVVQCGPSKKKDAIAPGGVPDQPSPFKAATRPPLLPLPAHKPYPTTRLPAEREGRARGVASRTRAEKQPPPPPPPPLARTASPSPSRDPQSRRRLLAGATPHCGAGLRADSAASSSPPAAVAVSPATRFELCCRGGGRPSRAHCEG